MNRIALITALTACFWLPASPASARDYEAPYASTFKADRATHFVALRHFEYEAEPQGEDKAQRFKSIKITFTGDCEDYAFTLQRLIGGTVFSVLLKNGTRHAVLVKDNMVFDNINQHPVPVETYHLFYGRFLKPRTFKKG